MVPSKKSEEIIRAFMEYHKTGDKSVIESYEKAEIETAYHQHYLDNVHPYYKKMEQWIQDLKEIEKQKKARSRAGKDKIIGFILGVIATVIGGIILHCLF